MHHNMHHFFLSCALHYHVDPIFKDAMSFTTLPFHLISTPWKGLAFGSCPKRICFGFLCSDILAMCPNHHMQYIQHYTFPNHLSHPVHLPNSSLRWGDSPCELLKAYDGKDTSETAIVGGLKLLVWFAFSHIAEFQVLQPCRLHVWSWLSVTCSKKLISLASKIHRNQLQCVLLCQLPHENRSAPCVVLCGVFYQSVLPT